MASTRDKNQPANYSLEQYSLEKQRQYLQNNIYAVTEKTMFCGDGLLTGRLANTQLSNNAVDIENFLYGIGANNLVEKKPDVVPEIKYLDSLNIFKKNPTQLPKPLVTERGQRLRFFE